MTRAAPGGALREGRSRPGSALPPAAGRDAEDPAREGAAAEAVPLPLRRRGRVVRVLVAGVAIAGVAGWVVLASPATAVTAVAVEGVSPRWAPAVRAAAEREIGGQLASVDLAALAARVQAVPGVLRASVAVRWPHTLVVRVVERTPAVAVRVADGVHVFDADGVELDRRTSAGPLPLVTVPARSLHGTTVAAALRVRDSLPASLRAQVVELGAADPDGVWFILRDRTRVVWGSADDAADKAAALAVMRSVAPDGHARTVDVSAPDAPAVS